MKKKSRPFSGLLMLSLAIFVFLACNRKVDKVDFTLNGENIAASSAEEFMGDSNALKVFVGDSVVFVNASTPEEYVKNISWSLTKDSVSINEAVNNNPVTVGFDEEGLYRMTLCVNGTEKCVTKMVFVQAAPLAVEPIIEPEPTEPPPPSPSHVKPPPSGGGGGGGGRTPPPPPPPVIEKQIVFQVPHSTSASIADHPSKTDDCSDFKDATFSVTLKPSKTVQLSSFKLFSDGCGGLNVSLKGADIDEAVTVSLNKGQTQVSFTGMDDPILEPGNSYVLTCTTVARYGSCSDARQPKIEDAKDCKLSVKPSPLLGLDQKGHFYIYELKFQTEK